MQEIPIPNNAGCIFDQQPTALRRKRWPTANSMKKRGIPSIIIIIKYGMRNAPENKILYFVELLNKFSQLFVNNLQNITNHDNLQNVSNHDNLQNVSNHDNLQNVSNNGNLQNVSNFNNLQNIIGRFFH